MAEERIELPQGTLDLLILKALALEPLHGWAVSERLQQTSRDAVQVPQGSLYPALHRLERKGWIKAHWGTSENNRRAKYYALTSFRAEAAQRGARGLEKAYCRRRPCAGCRVKGNVCLPTFSIECAPSSVRRRWSANLTRS